MAYDVANFWDDESDDELTRDEAADLLDILEGDAADYELESDDWCGEDDVTDNTDDYDDSMDGDWDSGMASAGFGTDEDYGYFGGDDY